MSDDELGRDDVMAIRGTIESDLSDTFSAKLIVSYVDDQSENTANTPYDGTDIGIAPFMAPYLPMDQYLIPGGQLRSNSPWFSTGDNQAAG